MSDMPVKIAVMGLGFAGQSLLRVMAKSKNLEPIIVCDLELKARQVSEQWRLRFTPRVEDILSHDDVEAVIIATPHRTHVPLAMRAIETGKAVFIEKPVSHSATEGRLLCARAAACGALAIVNYHWRSYPGWNELIQMATDKRYGRLQRLVVVAKQRFRTPAYYEVAPWRSTWQGAGGGALLNQYSHELDLLCRVAGLPVAVTASLFSVGDNVEVETDGWLHLEFANGGVGEMEFSTTDHHGELQVKAIFDNGEWDSKDTVVMRPGNAVSNWTDDLGWLTLLDNFASCILAKGSVPPIAPLPDSLGAVEIANAAIVSAVGGRKVSIPVESAVLLAVLADLASGRAALPRSKRAHA